MDTLPPLQRSSPSGLATCLSIRPADNKPRSVWHLAAGFCVPAIALLLLLATLSAQATEPCRSPGCAGTPYTDMPEIAPIGVHIDKYLDIPANARGPDIDPQKGYRVQDLGKGLYMVTENVYQSMFLVYEQGVVVVDAPPSIAANLRKA